MKFIKVIKKPVNVTTMLLGGMSSYDPHRGTDILHASDLTRGDPHFCPREYALLDQFGKSKKGMPINASMRHTFDMGRDIEHRVRNDYLVDIAVGYWKCTSCDQRRPFGKRPKTGCDREDIRCWWEYEEAKVKHEDLIGSFDLLVDTGKPKLRMVELKTVIKEDFVKLKAPLVEHRIRTIMYLHLIKQSSLADKVETDTGTVLYIAKSYGNYDKETGHMSPFREYEVKYDQAAIQSLLDQAAEFHAYRTVGTMPTGVCTTNVCKRAKQCGIVEECFSGKFKPGEVV